MNAMSNMNSSYRPHDPGHDYYAPGVYLITLVVRNRERNHELLGRLNGDVKAPAVVLTEIGKAVEEEWGKIPGFEQAKGRKVKVHAAVCMPDHFHGVIEVMEKMDRSVGQVIWGFKVACTKRWRALIYQPKTTAQPKTVETAAHPTSARMPTAASAWSGNAW